MYDSRNDHLRSVPKAGLHIDSPKSKEKAGHISEYGCRLVALSGRSTANGQLHRADMISPLLSGLEADEILAFEISLDQGGQDTKVAIRGTARGKTPKDSEQRADQLRKQLMTLAATQFPGFWLHSHKCSDIETSELAQESVISPHGRPIIPARRRQCEPGPLEVTDTSTDLLLPHMRFSPEGLSAAVELLKIQDGCLVAFCLH